MNIKTIGAVATAIGLISLGSVESANAASFGFKVNNWGSGNVTGTDLDADNLLNLNELTEFSADSLFGYTVSLSQLVGFGSFDLLAGSWIPNGLSWPGQPNNAYFTWNNQKNSVNSLWATVSITNFQPDVTPPDVTPIPTPALLPGLIGMGVAALRKKGREEEVVAQEA